MLAVVAYLATTDTPQDFIVTVRRLSLFQNGTNSVYDFTANEQGIYCKMCFSHIAPPPAKGEAGRGCCSAQGMQPHPNPPLKLRGGNFV